MSSQRACTCEALPLRAGLAEVEGSTVHKTFCPAYTPPADELEAVKRENAELRHSLMLRTRERNQAQTELIALYDRVKRALEIK